MPIASLSDVRPEVRAVVERYLATLEAGFCEVSAEIAADVLEETRAYVLDGLDPDSSEEDADVLLAGLGPADEYAAAMCAELRGGGQPKRDAPGVRTDGDGPGAGTLLGIPYDVRMPTSERIRTRWWNPQDPTLFTPRMWGMGWDLNFGALAVRLGLIRPDDQDEPFTHVPEGRLYLALAVPVLLCAAMSGAWALMASGLPAELPVHWGIDGQADRFAPSSQALGFLLAMGVVPTIWALISFVTRRSRPVRALVAAFAGLFAGLAGGLFAYTLAWPVVQPPFWVSPLLILGGCSVPFLILVWLARIDRRESWSADLRRSAQ